MSMCKTIIGFEEKTFSIGCELIKKTIFSFIFLAPLWPENSYKVYKIGMNKGIKLDRGCHHAGNSRAISEK